MKEELTKLKKDLKKKKKSIKRNNTINLSCQACQGAWNACLARDPYASADRARAIGVELVSFDQAITTADFISIHMPLTPTTSKILNDDTFAKMKKGVRIVNVARGGVIDEDALVRALDAGIVAQVLTFSYLIHIYLTVEESQ